jgi:N-acetyl-beta-hexosaminidase
LLVLPLFVLSSCKSTTVAFRAQEPIRGFMIDAARTVERMDHYYRFIDFCAEWGFNTLIFRLTDDEGSAYQFQSHPELKHMREH